MSLLTMGSTRVIRIVLCITLINYQNPLQEFWISSITILPTGISRREPSDQFTKLSPTNRKTAIFAKLVSYFIFSTLGFQYNIVSFGQRGRGVSYFICVCVCVWITYGTTGKVLLIWLTQKTQKAEESQEVKSICSIPPRQCRHCREHLTEMIESVGSTETTQSSPGELENWSITQSHFKHIHSPITINFTLFRLGCN